MIWERVQSESWFSFDEIWERNNGVVKERVRFVSHPDVPIGKVRVFHTKIQEGLNITTEDIRSVEEAKSLHGIQ